MLKTIKLVLMLFYVVHVTCLLTEMHVQIKTDGVRAHVGGSYWFSLK